MRSASTFLLHILCAGVLSLLASQAAAQQGCRGDVDDDDIVGPNDLAATVVVLFAEPEDVDVGTLMRADANDDAAVSAADLIAIVQLQGFRCPAGPTRTRTPTRTPTHTAIAPPTVTATRTPNPTPTPTQACTLQQASLGITNGTLTDTDCRRVFRGTARRTDAYTFSTSSGQVVRIEAIGTGGAGSYTPYIRVIDANGFFEQVEGPSPIEFTATTSLPYLIYITSEPTQPLQTGPYRMTLSVRTCPIETARIRLKTMDSNACPDLGSPSVGGRTDLADIYTFSITQPLTRVEITMEQSVEDSLLDPIISVYGPDGYELFPSFQADDAAPGGFGFNARARFLAVQTGTYTLVASGGGCDPAEPGANCRYRLIFSATQCPRIAAGPIPSTSPKVIAATLYGDTQRTACPAPVTIPGFNETEEPEVNSVADAYTFTAAAGDIISATMDSEGDSQLTLFGPLQAGNPFVTQNDVVDTDFTSQLAATLTRDGTYTLLAVNRTFLERPDPNDPQDTGDFVEYEAFLQQCRVAGGLVPSTGTTANGRFRVTDCLGFGGYPFQSFAFNADAGQVIATTMTSAAVNSSLQVVGAGVGAATNDDDPLGTTADARVIRTIPSTGVYFAEASTSREDFEPELGPAPSFSLSARACAPKVAALGTLAESFSDGDCDLGDGRKYDVFTLDGLAGLPPRPFVVSVEPPANACVLGLLPQGQQIFARSCAKQALDIPVVGSGTAAFVIAADGAAIRGAYTVKVAVCPLSTIGFGASHNGSLATAGCADTGGVRADWILFQDRVGLVRFNEGLSLSLSAGFATAASITDVVQTSPLTGRRGLDAVELLPLGENLGALVKVRGATVGDLGNYTVHVAPPFRRQ